MLKKNTNKLIKTLNFKALFFGVLILLSSCEKQKIDSLSNEKFGIEQKFEKSNVSFSNLKNENTSIDWLLNKNEFKDNNLLKESNKDFNYIKHIDSSKVTVFEDSLIKTYTLPIITSLPKEENDFFNLVIKKRKSNTSAFVVKYKPININGNNNDFFGKIEVYNKFGEKVATKNINNQEKNSNSKKTLSKNSNSNCEPQIETLYSECGCGGNADGHAPSGSSCCNGSPEIGYTITFCPDSGGSGTDDVWDNDPFDFDITTPPNDSNIGGGINGGSPTSPTNVDDLLILENSFWNSLNPTQKNYCLFNNIIYDKIKAFLLSHNYLNQAQVYAKEAIDILSLPELSSNDTIDTFKTRILKITAYFKEFGNPEDEFFADYIESLIPDFSSMIVGDVYDIYLLAREQKNNLVFKYFEAVFVPFAEAAYPFIVYAITEATLGAALPILAKLPKLSVFNFTWVNNLVKSIGSLGVRGDKTYVRIVTTNGNPYSKALELLKV